MRKGNSIYLMSVMNKNQLYKKIQEVKKILASSTNERTLKQNRKYLRRLQHEFYGKKEDS